MNTQFTHCISKSQSDPDVIHGMPLRAALYHKNWSYLQNALDSNTIPACFLGDALVEVAAHLDSHPLEMILRSPRFKEISVSDLDKAVRSVCANARWESLKKIIESTRVDDISCAALTCAHFAASSLFGSVEIVQSILQLKKAHELPAEDFVRDFQSAAQGGRKEIVEAILNSPVAHKLSTDDLSGAYECALGSGESSTAKIIRIFASDKIVYREPYRALLAIASSEDTEALHHLRKYSTLSSNEFAYAINLSAKYQKTEIIKEFLQCSEMASLTKEGRAIIQKIFCLSVLNEETATVDVFLEYCPETLITKSNLLDLKQHAKDRYNEACSELCQLTKKMVRC